MHALHINRAYKIKMSENPRNFRNELKVKPGEETTDGQQLVLSFSKIPANMLAEILKQHNESLEYYDTYGTAVINNETYVVLSSATGIRVLCSSGDSYWQGKETGSIITRARQKSIMTDTGNHADYRVKREKKDKGSNTIEYCGYHCPDITDPFSSSEPEGLVYLSQMYEFVKTTKLPILKHYADTKFEAYQMAKVFGCLLADGYIRNEVRGRFVQKKLEEKRAEERQAGTDIPDSQEEYIFKMTPAAMRHYFRSKSDFVKGEEPTRLYILPRIADDGVSVERNDNGTYGKGKNPLTYEGVLDSMNRKIFYDKKWRFMDKTERGTIDFINRIDYSR